MTSVLLGIIYLAFISLGLPDGLLGSAWPSMYGELGASVSWAGIVSMIISAGTIVSSLASDRVTKRFGAGMVTAVSVCMTAVSLFGFSMSSAFWQLCLWAVPYGLGAGSVDAALNNFVAIHYPARHMSWLHCMWGIGASIGPVIMGAAITGGFGWTGGYRIIALMQVVLTAVLFFSLPLWKKHKAENSGGTSEESVGNLTFKQIIRRPGVREVMVCFFCYCAAECTSGMWAASYCTFNRGITPEQAASFASLFYIGITAGRFVSGFLTIWINDKNMIRLGEVIIVIGIAVLMIPQNIFLPVGLVLIGCGCAPIYPSIIHSTPKNFGVELSQSMIGIQMASAYVGACLMPPVFGLVADYIDIGFFPLFILAITVLMIVMAERLNNAVGKNGV